MVDQGAAERAHGGEALGDGSSREESGASARGLAIGVDELGRPVAVAVDVGAPGGERMGAAPVKPDEVQGEVGRARVARVRGASCAGNRRRASRCCLSGASPYGVSLNTLGGRSCLGIGENSDSPQHKGVRRSYTDVLLRPGFVGSTATLRALRGYLFELDGSTRSDTR